MPGASAVPGMGIETIVSLVLMVVVFYFLIIAPQRKRDKKSKEMLASMEKGQEIVTIGGIEGKIIQLKDESVTIETGSDRTKLTFKKWAVRDVIKKEEA